MDVRLCRAQECQERSLCSEAVTECFVRDTWERCATVAAAAVVVAPAASAAACCYYCSKAAKIFGLFEALICKHFRVSATAVHWDCTDCTCEAL